MAILTDTKARNIKPEDKPIPHGGVTGLTLHSSSTKGRGKWVFRFVSPTTERRRNAGLGTYPEISIADASAKARLMREQLSNGIDPLEQKNEDLHKPIIPTFENAARLVHLQQSPGWKNVKHAKQWISSLELYVFPLIGSQLVTSITPQHIADVLNPIWLEIPETASRVKQRLHAVFSWAWAHGYCQSNPVDVVVHLLPIQPSKSIRTQHQPAMDWRILPKFYKQYLANCERYDVSKALLCFVILTACRSGEARGMQWNEVNFRDKVWTIPAERMKAKQIHRVPLSMESIEVLYRMKGLHAELVFPSPRKLVPLSDMAITSFLRRINAPSTTPGRVATAHGFRSTFRDWCSEQGYSRDLAERALAHQVQNKVEAAYHRTDLLEQRRIMMDEWTKHTVSSDKLQNNPSVLNTTIIRE